MSDNWSKYRLDEIAKLSMGQSPQSKFYNTDGDGLPFFQGKTEFGEYYPSVRQFTSKTTKKAVEGDVLFTVRAPVGELNIANQDCCIGRGLAAIQAKNENENRFLYYILKVNTELFLSRSSGAVYDAISGGDLKSSEIFIPNNSQERIKIAKILSNYDDLIENNLKRIKLLEESARLTYEEWFLRFRIDGKKLDIDPESDLPYGWEQSTLGSLVAFHGGYAFKSKDYEENQKYKIVTIKNVQDGYFISSTTDTISTIPDNIKPSQKLNNGDYIMSLTGNVGRICLIYGENYLLNQRVVKLEPKKSIDYSFLYSLFRHKNMLKQLENISNGAAQQNLSPVNAAKIKLPTPGEEFREKFNNKIKPAIDLIINLNLQNQFLKEARVILLPRLMTGMIDTEKIDFTL